MTATTSPRSAATGCELTELLRTLRGEILATPDLILTAADAARVWRVDRVTSALLLEWLAAVGLLQTVRRGVYGVRGSHRRSIAAA